MALATGSAIALAIVLARRRRGIAVIGAFAIIATGAALLFAKPHAQVQPGKLEITAIDVGQGDSLFLAFPDGKTMLLDSGGPLGGSHSDFDIGEQVVSPYLWSRGISRLDIVAYSHPHSDHMGALRPSFTTSIRASYGWVSRLPCTMSKMFSRPRGGTRQDRLLP